MHFADRVIKRIMIYEHEINNFEWENEAFIMTINLHSYKRNSISLASRWIDNHFIISQLNEDVRLLGNQLQLQNYFSFKLKNRSKA